MKKKDVRNKEEIAEDYCFNCKDGGHLRVCDFKNCLKAYHPHCVGKDQTFLETDERWTCGWHSCFICHKSSTFQCYCCPSSVCRGCIRTAEFVQVKKKTKGFCNNCLKLAILIEENADIDSDGGKVDFKDTETYEFLFKDYWEIVKHQEGLTLVDLHAADALLKRGEACNSGSESDKLLEEELMSEVDDTCDNGNSLFSGLKKKRGGMKTPIKRSGTRKKTFIGWGSEELIGFLSSIGKDTQDSLSQLDVSEIVKDYIQANNLFHPDKKRKIVLCDERLHSLFRKTKVKIYKIYSLLESHLAENADLDDEISFSSEEGDNPVVSKKQRRINSDFKVKSEPNHYRKKVSEPPKSEYAALVEKNIKSVYLRKSLILKFLKDPETFENKVIGCFVRVKSDPKDFYYLSHKLYQLGRIKGIKKVPQAYKIGETSTDIVLCISNIWKDIHISMLSDDDFEEEECEDLRQLLKKGLLERPTIAELDKKIKSIHEDIMNHWIDREILRLQKLIDRANEKGWRGELFEYIEKRELLRTPVERIRLLKEIPSVIADMEGDIDATASSPPNLLGEYQGIGDASIETAAEEAEGIGAFSSVPGQLGLGNVAASIENAAEEAEGIGVSPSVPGQLGLGGHAAALEVPLQEVEGNVAASIVTVAEEEVEGSGASSSIPGQLNLETELHKPSEANGMSSNKECVEIEADKVEAKGKIGSKIEIINLDDDDDDDEVPNSLKENGSSAADTCEAVVEAAKPESNRVWHYIDPSGEKQGPFSMAALIYWSAGGFFDADFKVWRTGQSPKEAILLTDALGKHLLDPPNISHDM